MHASLVIASGAFERYHADRNTISIREPSIFRHPNAEPVSLTVANADAERVPIWNTIFDTHWHTITNSKCISDRNRNGHFDSQRLSDIVKDANSDPNWIPDRHTK